MLWELCLHVQFGIWLIIVICMIDCIVPQLYNSCMLGCFFFCCFGFNKIYFLKKKKTVVSTFELIRKKVIKLFIYFIVDVAPITFIVMLDCKLFVVKLVVNFKYFPLKRSPMISGLNTFV